MQKNLEFQSLDDLLNSTYSEILQRGEEIDSKRGKNREITRFSATLLNPRVRTSLSLDRSLVKSKFAEFAWYLSKDKSIEYITPYISAYHLEEQENSKILGAYGPKIFGSANGRKSQFERVVEQIKRRPSTKQAYLSLSDTDDYIFRDKKYSSPPCTIGLHFYVRNFKLHLITYMRSNDAYFGLPHDLFCFTMLQELVSHSTNFEMGYYTHVVTSIHIYENHYKRVEKYLSEGLHEPIEMPPIQYFDNRILDIVSKEFDIKENTSYINQLDDYWSDFVLFSKKYKNDNINDDEWESKFRNKNMRLIAKNSLGY